MRRMGKEGTQGKGRERKGNTRSNAWGRMAKEGIGRDGKGLSPNEIMEAELICWKHFVKATLCGR